jgi:hypothetical protein
MRANAAIASTANNVPRNLPSRPVRPKPVAAE